MNPSHHNTLNSLSSALLTISRKLHCVSEKRPTLYTVHIFAKY